jgi:hypothetical protein
VGTIVGVEIIAIGHLVQFGNLAFIKDNSNWQPAAGEITSGAVVPISGIDIFVGFTGAI